MPTKILAGNLQNFLEAANIVFLNISDNGAGKEGGHKSVGGFDTAVVRMDPGRDVEYGLLEDDPGPGELYTTLHGQ